MQTHDTAVLVHINDTLSESRQHVITRAMTRTQGVSSVRFTEGRPHLMMLNYNPGQTHARDLLNEIRDTGLTAQLIGM